MGEISVGEQTSEWHGKAGSRVCIWAGQMVIVLRKFWMTEVCHLYSTCIVSAAVRSKQGEEIAITHGTSNLDLSRAWERERKKWGAHRGNGWDLQLDLYKSQRSERMTLSNLPELWGKRKDLPLPILSRKGEQWNWIIIVNNESRMVVF